MFPAILIDHSSSSLHRFRHSSNSSLRFTNSSSDRSRWSRASTMSIKSVPLSLDGLQLKRYLCENSSQVSEARTGYLHHEAHFFCSRFYSPLRCGVYQGIVICSQSNDTFLPSLPAYRSGARCRRIWMKLKKSSIRPMSVTVPSKLRIQIKIVFYFTDAFQSFVAYRKKSRVTGTNHTIEAVIGNLTSAGSGYF
jgi:hypothetical protein